MVEYEMQRMGRCYPPRFKPIILCIRHWCQKPLLIRTKQNTLKTAILMSILLFPPIITHYIALLDAMLNIWSLHDIEHPLHISQN